MTIAARQVNPAGTRVFMATLTDDADVHESLALLATGFDVQTATIELLGGLTRVEFTAYDFATQTRHPPLTFERPLEIVAGHGTISMLEGTHHVHLHLTVAFRDDDAPHGIAIVAGHAAQATAFAIEATITAYDGAPVERAMHKGTGLKLWNLPE